jgi:tRNA A-37 threonylcarbamoyl transferase component Bud32
LRLQAPPFRPRRDHNQLIEVPISLHRPSHIQSIYCLRVLKITSSGQATPGTNVFPDLTGKDRVKQQNPYKNWHSLLDLRLVLAVVVVCIIAGQWRPGFWTPFSGCIVEFGQWLNPPVRTTPDVALLEVDRPERALWGMAAEFDPSAEGSGVDQSLAKALKALAEQSKTIGILLPYPIDSFDLNSHQVKGLIGNDAKATVKALRDKIGQLEQMRSLLAGDTVVLGIAGSQVVGQAPLSVAPGHLADVVPQLRSWLWPIKSGIDLLPAADFEYFPALTQLQAEQSVVLEGQDNIYPGFALALLNRSIDRTAAGADAARRVQWRRDIDVLVVGERELPLAANGKLVPLVTHYSAMTPSFARLSLSAAMARPVSSSIVLVGGSNDPLLERSAATVAALVDGLVLVEPRWFAPLNKILLLSSLLGFFLLIPRISWKTGLALCAGLAVILVAIQLAAQLLKGWWLPMADLLWCLVLGFCIMQVWQRKQMHQEAQVRLRLPHLSDGDAARSQELPQVAQLQSPPPEQKNTLRETQALWARKTTISPRHGSDNNLATTLVMELDNPLVLGRYEIQRELGRGAMGTVYLAYDPKISRKVAIKTLNFKHFEEPQLTDIKARFFREAAAAGRLNHPHIVPVFDVGEEQDLAFIAMDYVDGQPLSKFVTEANLLTPFEAYRAAGHVARALHYAHQNNIIHRDIKPANIIYCADPYRLKVTDFGIARLVDESRTSTGEILGSPLYMAPEQLQGKTINPRADLFSLGVTFYQLLTGQLPFKGDNLASLTYDIIYGKPQSVRKIYPELPYSATRIINRALQKDNAKRFASAQEMAEAIEKAMRRDFPDEAKAAGFIV